MLFRSTMPLPPQTGSSSNSTVTRKRKAADTQDDADGKKCPHINIDSDPNGDVLERVSEDIQILRVAQTGLPEFSARRSLPQPSVPPARSAGAVQQSHSPPPRRRRIAVAATPPAAPAAPPAPQAPQAPVVESRPRRHRPTIPEAAQDRLPRAMSERLMLLYRSGIAGNGSYEELEIFTLVDSTGKEYTVRISAEPACDCPDGSNGRKTCIHIIYVMEKVLKAPPQIAFQHGLLPSELRHIFSNAPPRIGSRSSSGSSSSNGGGDAKRKPVGADDCPICFCPIEFPVEGRYGGFRSEDVVWCRAVCGTNVHASCFRQWRAVAAAKTNNAGSANGDKVTCVMCRAPWIDADGDSCNAVFEVAMAATAATPSSRSPWPQPQTRSGTRSPSWVATPFGSGRSCCPNRGAAIEL